jgi:pimeloyl-ACP methyl ester carboxylesterase
MTDDLAALIDHLALGPVDVIGWSDGGIEALLLGIRHPDKVRKIVSMSPNLTPGSAAFYPEVEAFLNTALASATEEARKTAAGRRAAKVAGMMAKEPNIDFELIEQIEAPTLILAGDHDMVRVEHVVEIFNRLQNGQLGILPNSTHMATYDNAELFNGTVERFLATPFTRRDRIADFVTSYERLVANLPR